MKKPYIAPVVTVHGDIRALTQGPKSLGGSDAGFFQKDQGGGALS